jgi:SAM-dependent methyltransferase
MRVDVLALQRFYASPLGQIAQRMIAARLRALWPSAQGLDFLGLGYPTPYLDLWRADARRAVALMPAAQGAEHWPPAGPGLTALADETRLPFPDAVFDRVLVVHALEEAEAVRPMLREVWRVMAPEGRLVVVAANRLGLWARTDATPFGHGRPYSRGQLGELLRGAMFEPTASARALHAPPLAWPFVGALADGVERIGDLIGSPFAGLVMTEAVKRLHASTAKAGKGVLLAQAPARPATSRYRVQTEDRDPQADDPRSDRGPLRPPRE